MPNELPPNNDLSNLRGLLEQNLQYSKEILLAVKRMHRYILWARIISFIKIILIVVPLILAYLYLQPYFRQAINTYQELFGLPAETTNQVTPPLTNDLLQEWQRLQKSGDLKNLPQLLK